MLHCLQICKHLDCSDPRDRLCAPAKLSEGLTKVIPDYSLPASDVYTALAANFVRHGEVNHTVNDRSCSSEQQGKYHRAYLHFAYEMRTQICQDIGN